MQQIRQNSFKPVLPPPVASTPQIRRRSICRKESKSIEKVVEEAAQFGNQVKSLKILGGLHYATEKKLGQENHYDPQQVDYKEEAEKWKNRCELLEIENSNLLVRLDAAEKKVKQAQTSILNL